jgi:inhibitor of cysteine peptidase
MNVVKKVFTAFCALLLIALAGCAGRAPAAQEYGKDNTNIPVANGKTFVIRIEENPSTGYSWQYVIADPSIVINTEDRYIASDTTGKLVGSGGKRVLTFGATKTGTTTIKLKYLRSWEPENPANIIVYNVTVM